MSSLFGDLRRPRRNRWDSPLILVGGGALILLIAAGIGFFALFYSETADEVFNAGKDAYESQSYGLAMKNFERFSQKFPQHEKASLSRVRIGMSKLRQITDGRSADWEAALGQATHSLPTIKQEAAFGEVRGELAKLLPDVTAGLVEKSKQAEGAEEKQRTLDLAVKALNLVNNPEYLPTSTRQTQETRIEEIESSIQVVRRDIERTVALTNTIERITAAADSGRIAEAYRLRDELMTAYPLLSDDVALSNTLSSVTAKERSAVKVSKVDSKPFTNDHPPVAKASIVLSDQRGKAIEGVNDHVLSALVGGAVYGLDASNGRVLWRRYVGFETNVFPQSVGSSKGSDFLIVDGSFSEVQRVEAETGKLVWRLPCPQPIASPRLLGNKAYICCGSGTNSALLIVDVATGQVAAEARFPVGCATQPAILESRKEIIQVGMHSSAYVLDAETLAAKNVIATGHARGSVVVAPVFVGTSLVIAENNGYDAAKLHVFSVDNDNWVRSSAPISLNGQVVTSPAVDDRRLLLATELGELQIFSAPIDGTALRSVASVSAVGVNLGPSHTLLDRSNFWVANRSFGYYELQSTRGTIVSKWSRDRDDRFLNPLQRKGGYLFHVRRRTGVMGATVSAIHVGSASDDGVPIWETDIGVPSRAIVSSEGTVHAVTVNGAMFPIDALAMRSGTTSIRSARIDPRLVPRAFSQQLPVSKSRHLFAGPPPISHVTLANSSTGQMERIPLRIGSEKATAPLVNYKGSILAASDAGSIYLLDANSGAQRTRPFTPRIEPGSRIDWLPPAPVGKNQFVAAEKRGRLYRVQVDNQQLALIKEGSVDGKLIGGLASLENTVYAARHSAGADQIVSINVGDLTVGSETPMRQGLAWGPKRVGRLVIAADGTHAVYAFDEVGKLRWRTNIPIGPLAGDPLTVGDRFVFTSTNGAISVVDQTGKVVASGQISEPIGSGPVAFKGNLLVAGWDGTLFMVDVPQ